MAAECEIVEVILKKAVSTWMNVYLGRRLDDNSGEEVLTPVIKGEPAVDEAQSELHEAEYPEFTSARIVT